MASGFIDKSVTLLIHSTCYSRVFPILNCIQFKTPFCVASDQLKLEFFSLSLYVFRNCMGLCVLDEETSSIREKCVWWQGISWNWRPRDNKISFWLTTSATVTISSNDAKAEKSILETSTSAECTVTYKHTKKRSIPKWWMMFASL